MLKEGVKERDIEVLKKPNFVAVNEFIFQYTDGIIQGDKKIDNKKILNKINTLNIPFLDYQDIEDLTAENFMNFYNKVLET